MSEEQPLIFTNTHPFPIDVLCESGTNFVQGQPIYVTEDDEWEEADQSLPVGSIRGYTSDPVVTTIVTAPGETVTLPKDTRSVRLRHIVTGTLR